MNKILFDGINLTPLTRPRHSVSIFGKTLKYVSESIVENYYTPDDVVMRFSMEGALTHPLRVTAVFQPYSKKTKRQSGKPMIIECTYNSDAELSVHLEQDLSTCLNHFLLSAAYNKSDKTINVVCKH